MNEIRILLYLILVISLYNLISYYRNKKSTTRTSRSLINGLSSTKTISSEQIKAVELSIKKLCRREKPFIVFPESNLLCICRLITPRLK